MYQVPTIKILPEYTFAVPVGTSMWEGYEIFKTLGEAIFYVSRQLGKNYKFIETKDHPSKHNFTAIFEYIDNDGNKQLKRKTITINNYFEVLKKHNPMPKYNRYQSSYEWDKVRALYGAGPYAGKIKKSY